jgi:hypothetical protein
VKVAAVDPVKVAAVDPVKVNYSGLFGIGARKSLMRRVSEARIPAAWPISWRTVL